VLILVVISSAITLFMGVFQILAEPLILSFSDAKTLGIAETICACGMLVSGVLLGVKGLKGHYVRILGLSLSAAGVFMLGFGLSESMVLICAFGFLFFAMLPLGNNCLDYLIRTNIPDEAQGRAWGLIGFLSQLGYVVAYALSGTAADALGRMNGQGTGTGAAVVIVIAGICLAVTAAAILVPKSIRDLEHQQITEE
jgi:MFS family permease